MWSRQVKSWRIPANSTGMSQEEMPGYMIILLQEAECVNFAEIKMGPAKKKPVRLYLLPPARLFADYPKHNGTVDLASFRISL